MQDEDTEKGSFEEFEGIENFEAADEVNFEGTSSALPDVPYWNIDQRSIVQLLRVIALISKHSVDIISRSIYLEKTGSSLSLRCTDKDMYLKALLPLKNEELRLDEKYILNSRQIVEVVKNSPDLIIYPVEGSIFCNLLGGHATLENYSFDFEIYQGKEPTGKSTIVSAKDFLEETNHLLDLMALAGRPEDKRIVVKEGRAYGLFLTALTCSDTLLPDLVLRKRDMEVLKNLLTLYITDDMEVVAQEDRIFFTGENFSLSFSASSSELPEDILEKFNFSSDFFINGSSASKILDFLASPVMKVAKVELNADDEGLEIVSSSQKGVKSSFCVTDTPCLEPFEADLNISLAKKVFSVVSKQPSVFLVKSEDSIILGSDKFKLVMSVR